MKESSAPQPQLRVSDLSIGHDGRRLLPPISFEMRAGELWAIVGVNGAGKSTLLRTLLGLAQPIAGYFSWRDRAGIGYVPQRATLDPTVPARVVDVVRGGLHQGWSFLNPLDAWLRSDRVREALSEVDVRQLARHGFSRLSEGQKQRVLMARALVSSPSVLVLDEPTSAMDVTAEAAVLALIRALRDRRELGVLLVTHHLSIVADNATHALVLDRDRRLVVAGPVEEVGRDEGVRSLFGNLLLTHSVEGAP